MSLSERGKPEHPESTNIFEQVGATTFCVFPLIVAPQKITSYIEDERRNGGTATRRGVAPQKSQIVLKTKWGDDEEENGGRVMGIFYFNAYDDRRLARLLAVLGANRRGGAGRAHWGNSEA